MSSNLLTFPVYSRRYVSAQQTIASATLIMLNHGLVFDASQIYNANVKFFLVCQTAELGYSVGDVLPLQGQPIQSSTGGQGLSVTLTTTQILVRPGSDANSIAILNKSTSAILGITNANWKLVVVIEI